MMPQPPPLMICPAGEPGRARVVGSLTGDAIQILLDAVHRGMAVLDLSEVDHVDDAAVRVLARLRRQGCTLLACPRWLALWLERAREDRHP